METEWKRTVDENNEMSTGNIPYLYAKKKDFFKKRGKLRKNVDCFKLLRDVYTKCKWMCEWGWMDEWMNERVQSK